jgi:hypothetical protein
MKNNKLKILIFSVVMLFWLINGNTASATEITGSLNITLGNTIVGTVVPPSSGGGGGGGGGNYNTVNSEIGKIGDLTGDNKVDEYDFAILMLNWNSVGLSAFDLNHDAIVNEYDFAILMANWSN